MKLYITHNKSFLYYSVKNGTNIVKIGTIYTKKNGESVIATIDYLYGSLKKIIKDNDVREISCSSSAMSIGMALSKMYHLPLSQFTSEVNIKKANEIYNLGLKNDDKYLSFVALA